MVSMKADKDGEKALFATQSCLFISSRSSSPNAVKAEARGEHKKPRVISGDDLFETCLLHIFDSRERNIE
jgi:hypothetical protein